jgi:hypothetical protein
MPRLYFAGVEPVTHETWRERDNLLPLFERLLVGAMNR